MYYMINMINSHSFLFEQNSVELGLLIHMSFSYYSYVNTKYKKKQQKYCFINNNFFLLTFDKIQKVSGSYLLPRTVHNKGTC